MKILVNGSSISSGFITWKMDPDTQTMTPYQDAWPYHLQKKLNCDMVNLAVAGAGNTYIHETTVSELSQRSYDLVLIKWTDFDRLDLRVNNPVLFSSLRYTSQAQSKKDPNNFLSNVVIDTDFIQQDWIFSGEYRQSKINDPGGNVDTLFGQHNFSSPMIQLENSLIKIISLQGVLKSLGIPYRFLFYKPLTGQRRFPNLFKLIDWQNVFNDPHLFSLAHDNNWWDHSIQHPTVEAYSAYADLLADYLKNQKLI
jgi:hypothetical protein